MERSMLITIPYTPRYPEIHYDLESHRFVVMPAHRRFGKTVIAVNHIVKMACLCKKPQGSFAYIAPLRKQAKDVAWEYFKHYSAPLPFRLVNESELCIQLASQCGSYSRIHLYGADNPDSLRGMYFDGVVLDEVGQMKPQIWTEILQPALADRQGSALFIGTPKGINLFSELYYYALKREADGDRDWKALFYPITKSHSLPESELVRIRKSLSDAEFRQEFLCDFSASSIDNLITLDEVQAAQAVPLDYEAMRPWPLIIGVDVARFGNDLSVFFPRQGRYALDPTIFKHMSNTELAHRLAGEIAVRNPVYVCIDQGQGTGVIDLLRDLVGRRPVRIVEIPFGSKANHEDRFINRRAEMWTNLRDWLRQGGRLPSGECAELLKAELTAPSYTFDASGRIKLEPKEAIKERLKRSTDLADALALTFSIEVGANEEIYGTSLDRYGHIIKKELRDWMRGTEKKGKRYDPFN